MHYNDLFQDIGPID